MSYPDTLIRRIQAALTPDLLKPKFRGNPNPLAGHCYVASETLFHMLGGTDAGYCPVSMKVDGVTHWWVRSPDGEVLDPTAGQFPFALDYSQGRGRGFCTKAPSARAVTLINRLKG